MTNKATAAIGTTTATAILAGSAMAPDPLPFEVMIAPVESVEVGLSVACGLVLATWVEVTVINAVLPSAPVLCADVITIRLVLGGGVVDVVEVDVGVVDEGGVVVVVGDVGGVEEGMVSVVDVEVGVVLVVVGVSGVVEVGAGAVVVVVGDGAEVGSVVGSVGVVLEVAAGAGVVGVSVDGLVGVISVVVSDGLDGLGVDSGTDVSALVELEVMVNCLATINPEICLGFVMLAWCVPRKEVVKTSKTV